MFMCHNNESDDAARTKLDYELAAENPIMENSFLPIST